MRRRLNVGYFGDERIVIHIEFTDQSKHDRYWWMVIDNGEIDLCFEDTGHDPDIIITTTLRTMTQVWLGYEKLTTMVEKRKMKMLGSKKHLKNISKWIGRSTFADS